jgi:predicted MPP superfamily phosphohydrolase
MRHIIIGDVHGCINELKSLIEKLQLEAEDKLYFIGDLIDKGPDSVGVVKFVRELSKRYPLILILGKQV